MQQFWQQILYQTYIANGGRKSFDDWLNFGAHATPTPDENVEFLEYTANGGKLSYLDWLAAGKPSNRPVRVVPEGDGYDASKQGYDGRSNHKNGTSKLDKQTKEYAELVKSNKPWSWKDFPQGDSLTLKEKREIKENAIKQGLISEVKYKPGTKYADFESAGLVEEVVELPENLWKDTDYKQFQWLDKKLGRRPAGYTWHHTEIPGKMELVPFGIHNIISHQGGRSSGHWADSKR